jgi:hypothetical protein
MKRNYSLGLILIGLLSGAAMADSLAAPAAASLAAPAAAGEFYVDPGIALTGAGAADYKNSFSLDAGYLKAVHQIASVGWEAGYLFSAKFEGDNFTSDAHAKILHITPEIKLGPTFAIAQYQVNAFVLGGGGLYWTHQNSGTETFDSGATAMSSSYDHINGGWNIGVGAALLLPGNWSVGIDIRRHDIVNKNTADFTWVTPALRFALLF